MKKFTILFAVLLLLICSAAYAADAITVNITALDYQSGKAVSKTYVENELFLLKVELGIPRFTDLNDMELIVELDGVEVDESNLVLADGTYYIAGIVLDQPAALRVTVKDKAYDNAVTAEQLYNAIQKNRTASKTYYFNATQTVKTTTTTTVEIPKTGAPSVLYPAIGLLALGFCIYAGKYDE